MRLLLVVVIATVCYSCSQKQVTATTSGSSETFISENNFNSVIEGKVLTRYKADDKHDLKYQKHASYADVKILQIVKNGQNYHGQFNTGDTIRIFFNFTMDKTEKLFPTLNNALPGLKKNDVFQAELIEKQGGIPQFTVFLYKFKDS